MKTRTDFVSNSSSCSFVVNDPVKMASEIKRVFGENAGLDIPWNIDSELSFWVVGSKDTLEAIAHLAEIDANRIYKCWGSSKEDQYELSDLSLRMILEVPEELLGKLESISMSCNDTCQDGVFVVKMMRRLLEKRGIKTDSCGDVECELQVDDFMTRLAYEVFRDFDTKIGKTDEDEVQSEAAK